MAHNKFPGDRRDFLKNAALAGAGTFLSPAMATTMPSDVRSEEAASHSEVGRPGSDFMLDVIKSLGIEYVCANPGSSFRGLHESVINYGGNRSPELITCCHEESAVAMAHGYAKIEGKPICVFAHGTVGLQHAAMAIYNAYCDRVPVCLILGNTLDASLRAPGHWVHCVQDAAAMVRDYVKWDDVPASLQPFAESAVRAYKIAMTPPMGPVLLVADTELQERPVPENSKLNIPKLTLVEPPQGESGAVQETARLLLQAENPLIVADRAARTQAGMDSLIELAELLQAPVIDQNSRMNFPTSHPLNHSAKKRAAIAQADVILGLELADFWGTVNSFSPEHLTSHPATKPGTKLISMTTGDLYTKANYQDFQRFTEVDIALAADAQVTLPSLIEAVRHQITADQNNTFKERGAKLAAAHNRAREEARTEATYAWDASPVSTARLCAELWDAIKVEDWSLVSYPAHCSWWPLRLWNFDKHYQFIGGPGAFGEGYGAPASVGAALANRKHGRLSVNIQTDGDLMYAPGILWTAAHHNIPILNIMHNNRAYHAEVLAVQRMANQNDRGIDRAGIGTVMDDPAIDFAKLAQSMGVYAEGPIANPRDVSGAIRRAIAVVKRGEPALVDVVTQAR
ncbi:MAG TPA: thiamine pyrophosphate-binding protein [Terriglobales bacterium]|jgi:thiamine pyrophosphate-dependent acetolactate synthase large subunit-like protein|nr:thiamine pyrophosphate-binding protein [Terriglobales bacterium]